jgi:TM2 domain-containing membrane protein YozV
MATRRRNPLMGGIFAMLFIGFGTYRFYIHYSGQAVVETWQLIIAGALILYGLFVAYSTLTQKNESENE